MSARSGRIVAMVLEYGRCFSEALMHEAASKADISESEAHKWIRRLRVEIDELDALAESEGSRAVEYLRRARKAEETRKLRGAVSDFVRRDAQRFRKLLMQDKHWLGVFRCDPDGAPSDSLSHVELTALLDAMDDPTLEF